jgi:hypothetical protein
MRNDNRKRYHAYDGKDNAKHKGYDTECIIHDHTAHMPFSIFLP